MYFYPPAVGMSEGCTEGYISPSKPWVHWIQSVEMTGFDSNLKFKAMSHNASQNSFSSIDCEKEKKTVILKPFHLWRLIAKQVLFKIIATLSYECMRTSLYNSEWGRGSPAQNHRFSFSCWLHRPGCLQATKLSMKSEFSMIKSWCCWSGSSSLVSVETIK